MESISVENEPFINFLPVYDSFLFRNYQSICFTIFFQFYENVAGKIQWKQSSFSPYSLLHQSRSLCFYYKLKSVNQLVCRKGKLYCVNSYLILKDLYFLNSSYKLNYLFQYTLKILTLHTKSYFSGKSVYTIFVCVLLCSSIFQTNTTPRDEH